MKKKHKKKKFSPYKLFCASVDSSLTANFKRFAEGTRSSFVDASGSADLFGVFLATPAFCYLLDFEHYQGIKAVLDERYGMEPIKPLIIVIDPKPFITPQNVSEWVFIWDFLTDEQLLSVLNVSRSRIRA